MPIPHYLHVYQKPAQGSAFIRRYPAMRYSHRITAVGGFDTALCELAVTQIEGEMILENYIGNWVAIYVDNPCEPAFEGLINTIELQSGGVVQRRSLDAMLNAAVVTYTANAGTTQTAVADDLDSQAIYGVKAGSLDVPQSAGTAGNLLTQHEATRDTFVAYRAWPQTSTMPSPGSDVGIVRIEIIGPYHTLEWQTYVNTSVTDRTITAAITTVLNGLHNDDTFFDNADVSLVNPDNNTAFTKRDQSQWGKTVWQFLQDIQESGDGIQRYIMGITPTNWNTGTRKFYYRAANSDVEYIARVRDGMRVRNVYGGLERPWALQPDRAIRINDVLTGWNARGDDPRETYIDSVNYDTETQTPNWQGVDDASVEGVYQTQRLYKQHNTRYGAPPKGAIS